MEIMTTENKKMEIGKPAKPLAFDAVIFDIDNVLVDTRTSYLEVIRRTIDIFLTEGKVPFFRPNHKSKPVHILSQQDVNLFKLLGGFNDDWDCCYGLLTYLLSLPLNGHNIQDLRKGIQMKAFIEKVKKRPLGVAGITKMLGRNSQITIERIERIFQEIYLGKALFEKIEKVPARFWMKKGLIHREKLIFRKSLLEKLKEMGAVLGITTGRSRFEAAYALRHFGIESFFDAITTMDEIRNAEADMKQSLRKPHPFSLIRTAEKLGSHRRFLYIGDLPDDILTAKRAKETVNIQAVGFPSFSFDPKITTAEMTKQKVDVLISRPAELLDLVKKGIEVVSAKG